MKATARTVLITFFVLLVPSCHERKSPLTKEAEIISRLQHDKSQPDKYRQSVGILLDMLQEKENIKIRDYLDAKRQVSSVRSGATAQAWLALLQATEMKLPEKLPSAEEIDFERRESNRKQIKVAYFDVHLRLSLITSCISTLSSLDLPEAKAEVESFIQRFEKKYGGSSGGEIMLDSFKLEKNRQEERVRKGNALWQTGPGHKCGLE